MSRNKAITAGTAAFAAALAASLLFPPLCAALPVSCASLAFITVRGGAGKRLRFVAAMTLPLAAGMWLVHGGVFSSLVSGREISANYGAFAIWLRIFAVVAAGQAWLSFVGTEEFIRFIFASRLPPGAGFLIASPLLLAEQIKLRMAQISEAQLARGVDIRGSIAERAKALSATLLPLILGLLSDLPARSAALDMKGFGLVKNRTSIYRECADAHVWPVPDCGEAAKLEGVSVKSAHGDKTILSAPYFSIKRGEWAMAEGASGSGKSTLAMLLCGAIPEHMNAKIEGEMLIFGRPVQGALEMSPFVQYVQQNPAFALSGCTFTVYEETAFSLENIGLSSEEIKERAEEALRLTGAEQLAGRNPRELSGGELQKCAISFAAAMRPGLLILDEAFGRIHPQDRGMILQNLKTWSEAHMTSVLLLEQRECLPVPCGTKHWRLDGGLLEEGAPERTAPFWPHCRAYTGGESLLEIEDLTFAWEKGGEPLLKGISAKISRGERIALIGANGAGKSTLLRLAAGLLVPSSGRVLLNGTEVHGIKPKARASKTAFLFQDSERQIFHSTVEEEAAFALRCADMDEEEKKARVRNALEQLSLADKRLMNPFDLPSAERRMTGVASIAAAGCGLLLLDEPTRDMDEKRQLIFERWLAEQDAAVLAISHDPAFTARAFHKKWLLKDGRITVLDITDGVGLP